MAGFSFGEAFGSGFRVIGRDPLALVAWTIAYLVIGLLPIVGVAALMLPDLVALFQSLPSGEDTEPSFAQMMQLQSKMMMLNLVSFVVGLVVRGVLAGAIYRAVLEPQNRGFFYLRIGMQEVWLAILFLVMGILLALAIFATLIPVAGVAVALGFAIREAAPALIPVVVVVAVVGEVALVTWLALRLSLAPPMTFAERQFRLFESWSLTRGHTWSLFALGLALAAISLVVVLVFEGVAIGIGFAVFGQYLGQPERIQAFFNQPVNVWLAAMAPWIALVGLLISLLGVALTTIFMAPWAEVYRQLTLKEETFA
jgi:hypothetical protein